LPHPKRHPLAVKSILKSPVLWFAERFGPLFSRRRARLSRPPRLRPVRPNLLSSFLSARLALRSGVGLEDYLQHRLAQRLGALPVVPSELPAEFSIEEGGQIGSRPSLRPSRPSRWIEALVREEGTAALGPKVELVRGDLAHLAARAEEQRRRVADARERLEGASRDQDLADPRDEAIAERLGRPAVPLPLGLALQVFALLLMLAETWQLTLPGLKAGGLPVRALGDEFDRDPVNAVFGALFALGGSASLFAIAHLLFVRSRAALEGTRRRVILAGLWATSGVLSGAFASSVGGARPRVGITSHLTLVLVGLAIPVCAAWLVRQGQDLERERARAKAAARAWQEMHYKSYDELARLAGVLAEEAESEARLEAERARAARHLRELQERSAETERLVADGVLCQEDDLARLAQGVAAALEQDRYEYLRQATQRGLAPEGKRLSAPARGSSEVERNLGLAG
jgi:hypothetical protein